ALQAGKAETLTEAKFLERAVGSSLDFGLPSTTFASVTFPEGADPQIVQRYNSFRAVQESGSEKDKIEKYASLVASMNAADTTGAKSAIIAATQFDFPPSYDKDKHLKASNALASVKALLEKRGNDRTEDGKKTYDGCDFVVADTYREAINLCSSSSDSSCIKDKADELFEDGDGVRSVSRSIASLRLNSLEATERNSAFSDLGETNHMACDALAQNRRGGMDTLEAFDREILGENYNRLMQR